MAYKMTHPESDLEIQVDREHLDAYLSQGWETATNVKPPTGDDA